MTVKQLDALMVINRINDAEIVKNAHKLTKTPLELQMRVLCSKMRNSIQTSENWIETVFDSVELLLGKEKVNIT